MRKLLHRGLPSVKHARLALKHLQWSLNIIVCYLECLLFNTFTVREQSVLSHAHNYSQTLKNSRCTWAPLGTVQRRWTVSSHHVVRTVLRRDGLVKVGGRVRLQIQTSRLGAGADFVSRFALLLKRQSPPLGARILEPHLSTKKDNCSVLFPFLGVVQSMFSYSVAYYRSYMSSTFKNSNSIVVLGLSLEPS